MILILEGTAIINNVEEFLQKLKKIGKERKIILQAMDAGKLAGEKHIRFAVKKAMGSFASGTNIANDLAHEIMLYAAGTRQINKAVKLGIHAGENDIVVVAVGDAPELSDLDEITRKPVLKYDKSKKDAIKDFFGITEEEIQAVGENKIPELVIERVALVDVIK
ncbi:MAG TPA: KEOPS complex subunit Cgi121 [Candidatus Methanoperedens sp.]